MKKIMLFVTVMALAVGTALAGNTSPTARNGSPASNTLSIPCGADCLFYGGDFNGVNGLANENNTIVSDAEVFDNAVVAGNGWNVTDITTNNLIVQGTPFDSGIWEIRSGVSSNNGGTVVASGTVSGANFSVTPNGQDGFGLTGVFVECDFPSVNIPAGTFWFSCVPVDHGQGRSFESTTSGPTQGIGGGGHVDSDSFFNSNFFGTKFESACDFVGTPCNFSFEVSGTLQGGGGVPEPSSLLLMGSGLVGLAGIARRKLLGR